MAPSNVHGTAAPSQSDTAKLPIICFYNTDSPPRPYQPTSEPEHPSPPSYSSYDQAPFRLRVFGPARNGQSAMQMDDDSPPRNYTAPAVKGHYLTPNAHPFNSFSLGLNTNDVENGKCTCKPRECAKGLKNSRFAINEEDVIFMPNRFSKYFRFYPTRSVSGVEILRPGVICS